MVSLGPSNGTPSYTAGIHINMNGGPDFVMDRVHPFCGGQVLRKPVEVLVEILVLDNSADGWTSSSSGQHSVEEETCRDATLRDVKKLAQEHS